MRKLIFDEVKKAVTLAEVRQYVIRAFESDKNQYGTQRIGYVAGIITSDGPEHINKNWKILTNYTEKIKTEQDFPIFSATDIFSDEVFARINASSLSSRSWIEFWREILNCGYITDIFMTPRWEKSSGARDEHETAKKAAITIHYTDSKKGIE